MKTFRTILSALSLTLVTCALVYSGSNFITKQSTISFADAPILPIQFPDSPSALATDTPKAQVQSNENLVHFLLAADNSHYIKKAPEKQTAYFYAEIKAGKFSPNPSKKRTPLNISVVIDKSGSMEGDKLAYVKKAAAFVVDNLGENDLLSIVMYDSEVSVLFPSAKVQNKQHVKNLIATIESGSSTNLSGGMINGFKEVKSNFKPGYMNRVLLLTDGLANEGIVEPERLQSIASSRLKEEAISLSTFGVGADFNEDLLQNLAEYGNGNYYFIESPDKIPDIFQKEMKGLLSVVAQNTLLTLNLPEGATLEKVYGYRYTQNKQQIDVHFKDLFSEETKAILVQYSLPPAYQQTPVVKAKLNYDDATQESVPNKSNNLAFELLPAANEQERQVNYNSKVWQQIALFESNAKMEEAMVAVDKGEYEKARTLLKQNDEYLKEKRSKLPMSAELKKQDSLNQSYSNSVNKAESMSSEQLKIMQKSNKCMNYEVRKKK